MANFVKNILIKTQHPDLYHVNIKINK